MREWTTQWKRLVLFKLLSYHLKCTFIKLQRASCFVCTYVAISIPRFKLNCAHTHFPGSVLLRGGIFILITPSTRSYQVPTSQLDNSTPCLYTHFACTYLAISAQRFKLNCKHSHFPGPSLLDAGVFALLTPSISCVYSYTFLAISQSV